MEKEIINGMNISKWLKKWAKKYGMKEALQDYKSTYSYGSLYTNVTNLSYGFYEMGIRKGDKIILQLHNCSEFVITCFALMCIGAIPVLVVPGLRINDLNIIAKKINPVAYIRPDEYMGFSYIETGISLKAQNSSIKYILGTIDIDTMMLCSYPEIMENISIEDRDIGVILLSGGTTNIPKLIPITHFAFAYHALCAGKICQFNEETVYMAVMPVEHKLTLFSPGIMGTLYSGGKVIMCPNSSCEEAFPIIEEKKVNAVSLVPSVAKIWIEDLVWDDSYDLSSMRYCIIGGARLEEIDACRIMNLLKCKIIQAYGMSEGFLSLSRCDDSFNARACYQGKPMSMYDEVKVIDEQGNELSYENEGELLIRGPYMFSGYYDMDSLKYFTPDGFYYTGDLGYITSDGYIKITGRKSDQINRMGEKIMPSEIEHYLMEHEKIKEAVVVGIPDMIFGERSCAFLKIGDCNLEKREL